jgi:hypothetical protein
LCTGILLQASSLQSVCSIALTYHMLSCFMGDELILYYYIIVNNTSKNNKKAQKKNMKN